MSVAIVLTLISIIGAVVGSATKDADLTDLNDAVDRIRKPQFAGLRLLIDDAGWPVQDAENTYVGAAVVALESICVNDMLKVWMVKNEEISKKYESWFRNRCDDIMPTYKKHRKHLELSVLLNTKDKASGESDLYRMGHACRELFKDTTKKRVREQFILNVFKHNRRLLLKFGLDKAYQGISIDEFWDTYRLQREDRAAELRRLKERLREEEERRKSELQQQAENEDWSMVSQLWKAGVDLG